MGNQSNGDLKRRPAASQRGRVKPASSGLIRDLALLEALASDEAHTRGGIGVVRLAQLVERDKSQVSRALRALESVDLVERDPITRQFRLGGRLFGLAAKMVDARLLQIAPEAMRALVAQLGESVHLCVLDNDRVLTLHSEAPRHYIRASGWVGRIMPGYCSSAARALLIDSTFVEVEQRFKNVTFEPVGPVQLVHNVQELYAQICIARQAGYAVVSEEFEPELVGVSAPVRDFRGVIVAALNVGAPKFRLGTRLQEAGRITAIAAQELSRRLGWLQH
jgi:DNA-binding IclR family transcriptional regulator